MAQKTGIRLVGVVENMTGDVFGSRATSGGELVRCSDAGSIPAAECGARASRSGNRPIRKRHEIRVISDRVLASIAARSSNR
jgi:hypothetical protein